MKHTKKIIAILVIGLIVFWLIWSEYKNRHLRTHFIITTGHITGITGTSYKNNNRSVLYDYEVAGKLLHGENNLAPCVKTDSQGLRLLLVNQEFPVAYDTDNFQKSDIILRQREAALYNYQIPPSRQYIDSVLSCK
ncbi:hypothetical protein [Sediminibacterium sp.]|uniref:hypothetical protein n=1 Tax=Sediminibacterium sp. TaxID=1917865 RepID=UPI0025D171E1|nr:hypothetical protein [Sediminibacterium sp.]MBT9484328.1 hypothetical protein [Sediminibacterium sp.]